MAIVLLAVQKSVSTTSAAMLSSALRRPEMRLLNTCMSQSMPPARRMTCMMPAAMRVTMMSSLMPMMPSLMARSQPKNVSASEAMPIAPANRVAEASTSITSMPHSAATIIYI